MANCELPSNPIEHALSEALSCEVPKREIDAIILQTQESLQATKESIEKLQQTISYIWHEERLFVLDFFQLPADPDWFISGIEQIQKNMNFSPDQIDGIIWPYTLRKIYENYYMHNYERLGMLQKWRITIYNEVWKNYPDWTRRVKERWNGDDITLRVPAEKIPNIFDKQYYFWATQGMPIDGWFINSDILTLVPHVIPERINAQWVQWFLRKIHGKYMICIYINGTLWLASYSSPWNTQKYWDSAATPEIIKTLQRVDSDILWSLTTKMHYISWGKDSVWKIPNIDGTYSSDPMPYAVGVDTSSWIYTHAGFVDASARSHGCPRLPAHYARGAYEIFKIYWEITWNTHIHQNIG